MKTLQLNIRFWRFAILLIVILLTACEKDDDDILKDARVVYEEDFNGNSGWYFFESPDYHITESDGKLVQQLAKNDGTYRYTYNDQRFTGSESKQIIEYTLRMKSGTGGVIIVFNLNNTKETLFYLSENQHFKIAHYFRGDDKREEVVDWTENKLIDVTKMSVVKIELENGTVNFYINGKKLYQWNNSGITSLDYFGFGITMWEGSTPTTVELDKVRAIAID